MTDLEDRAWDILKLLRPEGIHVRRQHPVGRYIADFAIMRARLAIEIDGPLHEQPEQKARDGERNVYFGNAGWLVMRISAKELDDNIGRIASIRAALPSPRGEGERSNIHA